ncbi:hypothetical protein H8958_006738, partial [Nasalis larvatus]
TEAWESSHPLLRCEIPCPPPGTDRDRSFSLLGGAASCDLDALKPEHRNRRYPPSFLSGRKRRQTHWGTEKLKHPAHHGMGRNLATSLPTAPSLGLGKGQLLVSIRFMDTTKKRARSETFNI